MNVVKFLNWSTSRRDADGIACTKTRPSIPKNIEYSSRRRPHLPSRFTFAFTFIRPVLFWPYMVRWNLWQRLLCAGNSDNKPRTMILSSHRRWQKATGRLLFSTDVCTCFLFTCCCILTRHCWWMAIIFGEYRSAGNHRENSMPKIEIRQRILKINCKNTNVYLTSFRWMLNPRGL